MSSVLQRGSLTGNQLPKGPPSLRRRHPHIARGVLVAGEQVLGALTSRPSRKVRIAGGVAIPNGVYFYNPHHAMDCGRYYVLGPIPNPYRLFTWAGTCRCSERRAVVVGVSTYIISTMYVCRVCSRNGAWDVYSQRRQMAHFLIGDKERGWECPVAGASGTPAWEPQAAQTSPERQTPASVILCATWQQTPRHFSEYMGVFVNLPASLLPLLLSPAGD